MPRNASAPRSAPDPEAGPTSREAILADLVAPSVHIIYGAMRGHQRMTSADLRNASGLPRRTVYSALNTLRRQGLLLERGSLRDTRQTYYWLADEQAREGPTA